MDDGVVIALIGLVGAILLAWAGYRVIVKGKVSVDVFHHGASTHGSKREGDVGRTAGTETSNSLAFPDEISDLQNSDQTGQNHGDPAIEEQSGTRRGPKTRPPSERFSPAATGIEPPVLDTRPIEPGDYEGLTGSDLDARFISDYDWLDHEGGSFTVYRSEQ